MAEIKILMHSLGDEMYVVDTLYVNSDTDQIETTMREVGMPPEGWRAGHFYSAIINGHINPEGSMSLDEFKTKITTR